MAMPNKLKAMNLYGDGDNWQGQVETITPPKLQRNMTEWRGAGMDGPVDVDMGMQKMEMSVVLGGLIPEVFNNWGTPLAETDSLRFLGSYEDDETGDVHSVEITARGRYSNIDMGDAKPGETTEHTLTLTLNYYRLVIDGKALIEVDVIHHILTVNGVDRLAARRKALGLS